MAHRLIGLYRGDGPQVEELGRREVAVAEAEAALVTAKTVAAAEVEVEGEAVDRPAVVEAEERLVESKDQAERWRRVVQERLAAMAEGGAEDWRAAAAEWREWGNRRRR